MTQRYSHPNYYPQANYSGSPLALTMSASPDAINTPLTPTKNRPPKVLSEPLYHIHKLVNHRVVKPLSRITMDDLSDSGRLDTQMVRPVPVRSPKGAFRPRFSTPVTVPIPVPQPAPAPVIPEAIAEYQGPAIVINGHKCCASPGSYICPRYQIDHDRPFQHAIGVHQDSAPHRGRGCAC